MDSGEIAIALGEQANVAQNSDSVRLGILLDTSGPIARQRKLEEMLILVGRDAHPGKYPSEPTVFFRLEAHYWTIPSIDGRLGAGPLLILVLVAAGILISVTTFLHLVRFGPGFKLLNWLVIYIGAPLLASAFYVQHEIRGAVGRLPDR